MQINKKFNKGICFLLCVIDISSKYTWVITLKDKKGITITNAFQKILNESNRKLNKIGVDKGSEFYNGSMKSFFQNNNIDMNSTHNEGKFSATKKFIRTLKNKLHKYMTLISKNVYIDKSDDTVSKYNNAYHKPIKMKPADVNLSIHIDFNK